MQTRTTVDQKTIYSPLPWQIAPWKDKAETMLLTGSAGGGKSRLAAEKIHGFLKHYENATGIAMRKAREFASKSVVPFLQYTVIGRDSQVKFNKAELTFHYKNGSTLYIGGMKDQSQREAIRSMGGDGSFDIAWIEEANAFTMTDFEELLGRMRGRSADWTQVILSTNPDSPYHWINTRLIQGGEAVTYFSTAKDNHYNPESYFRRLDQLTGLLALRLREGKWAIAEGVVYSDWNEQIHVHKPFKIPDAWPRYLAIDFGYTNPFVCLWIAVDYDGRLYIYRELYKTKRLLHSPDGDDHISQIKANLNEVEQQQLVAAICDSANPDNIELINKMGIPAEGADKDIASGIQLVEGRLKVQGDGKPRLYYLDDALIELDTNIDEGKPRSIRQEFTMYVWPEGKDGKPLKEVPVDDNNHGLDGLRYFCKYYDMASGVDIVSLGDMLRR